MYLYWKPIWMNRIYKLFFFLLFSLFGNAVCFTQEISFDSLCVKAKEQQKPILLYFSGSDWCVNCIRFDKQIVQDTVFQNFALDNILLYNADFPQRKNINPEQLKQNETLAARYNPEGIFPTIVLYFTDADFVLIDYKKDNTAQFIAKIQQQLVAHHK